jgi:hypothetical protein
VAIDDNAVVNVARLFNEENGREYLAGRGVPESLISSLDLLGFSGISNVLTAIKMARYYEMGEHDVIFTILTDSMELYQSRLHEMRQESGEYSERAAAADYARWILQQSTDNLLGATPTAPHPQSTTPGSSNRKNLRRDSGPVVPAGLLDRYSEAGRRH